MGASSRNREIFQPRLMEGLKRYGRIGGLDGMNDPLASGKHTKSYGTSAFLIDTYG